MSYILDALRRADTERQRGAVPGLHAPAAAAAVAEGALARQSPARHWALAAGAAALLLAAGGVGWLGLWREAPTRLPAAAAGGAPPATVTQAPPAPATPLQQPTQPVLPQPLAQAPPMGSVSRVAPPPPLLTPLPLPAGEPPRGATAVRPPTVAATAAPAVAGVASASEVSPPVASAAAPPTRLPTLAELPESLRHDLPALSLGGAVYSEQPSLRMVIINGQLFHEGDKPAAELLVQHIGPKSVVFSVRGQRFEMSL